MAELENKNKVKKELRFTCILCAFMWWTREYPDPVPFRKGYNKIQMKCPRCGYLTEKAVDSNKSIYEEDEAE